MALSFVVEAMAPADLPEVMAIERASFRFPWSERAFLSELALPYTIYRVARLRQGVVLSPLQPEPSGRRGVFGWGRRVAPSARCRLVVGYAGMQVILDEAHVMTIAVHPDYRRRGIGELLLLQLFEEGAARGALRLTLEVRPSNQGAQELYRKYGFTIEGRRRHYYGDGEDALLMWSGRLDEPAFRAALEDHRRRLWQRLEGSHDVGPGAGNVV